MSERDMRYWFQCAGLIITKLYIAHFLKHAHNVENVGIQKMWPRRGKVECNSLEKGLGCPWGFETQFQGLSTCT